MAQQQSERSFIEKARRAQIVDAAVETLAAWGFARASLARIAERAGISKGVISYHFAGKNELIEVVVEQIYERIGAFVGPRMEEVQQVGGGGWLRVYIQSVAAYMADHRTQLAALGEIFSNFRKGDGDLRYGVVSSEPIYAALEENFRRGQECGDFRPFDARVMAVSLQSGIDAMFAYWSTYPEHDLAAHARELADLFERATRGEDRSAEDHQTRDN
ncbi:putative TetR family transcriptional regulator [Streptomyces sp. NBRC 110611]|uniref:TetR/AcrR family transcriptional regulator n=1 Tax=Streptomyces sp. NBRC 110611 TaxID=1621259 RepID=UPI00082E8631|nr:TetR/AcrR family transcriptional regulator [Streptomyces sp. NBRC 110611]GAU65073.1 putative TetR family transcriptional regulator [Streptomyces sp. NBRC 110611]